MAQTVLDHLEKTHHRKLLTHQERENIILAGLTHDLGHGIFSHLFDGVVVPRLLEQRGLTLENLNNWTHEVASEDLLRDLVDSNNIDLSK